MDTTGVVQVVVVELAGVASEAEVVVAEDFKGEEAERVNMGLVRREVNKTKKAE